MSLNPRDLLIKNAEAFAAGKVLGMSEDEVLTRLQSLSEQKDTSDSNKLNAAFLDEAVETKFGSLENAPSGQDLLREAKRQLNRSRREQGYKKGQVATPEQRAAAMEEALSSSLQADIMFERTKRDDPTTILRDANASMPGVVQSLEGAGLEGSGEFIDSDGNSFYADGTPSTRDSAFSRTRGTAQPDFDGSGYYDATEDANVSSAIARNTFTVGYTPDGQPIRRTFREDEPIPRDLREKGIVQRQLMQETYPQTNYRVSSPVNPDAATGEETNVFESQPYDAKPEYNAYLVRNEDGSVRTFSRTQEGKLIPDPNGQITVKRVLQGDEASSREPVRNQSDGSITGAYVNRKGEVRGLPQQSIVIDSGVKSNSGNIFGDELYRRGRATAEANGPRISVSNVSARDAEDLSSRGNVGDIPDLARLMGRKEMKVTPAAGDGFRVASDRTSNAELEIDDAGRYVYYDKGEPVVYGQNTPDANIEREMQRYSDAGIERTRRARRVGEILGELRNTTAKKGQKPKIFTNAEENLILSQRLGVSLPEAVAMKEEFKQEMGMGQSPQAYVRNLDVPSMSSGDYPQVDIGSSLQKLQSAIFRASEGTIDRPIRSSQEAFEALALYQKLPKAGRPTLAGESVRRLTGGTRLPTIREDNFTPSVEEVITARIDKRDNLLRIRDQMQAQGLGSGEGGIVTFGDLSANTGLSSEQIKQVAMEGKEADVAAEQIKAVGVTDAQLPESIQRASSTPIQGGFLEAVGTMEEFRDPSDRNALGMALKQLQMAEESGINQDKKNLFRDTGRTRMQDDVQTSRLTQGEQMDLDIKAGRDSQIPPSVITADGQRLLPGTRKDGLPAPVPQVPVARNADGSVMDPNQAIAQERRKVEGFKNYTPEQRESRIARFSAKQRNAANYTAPEEQRLTGEVTDSDPQNAGLREGNIIADESSRRANDNSEFLRQQQAPLTNEAVALGKLRSERGNLDAGVPLDSVPGLAAMTTPARRANVLNISLEDAGQTMQGLASARETQERFMIPDANPKTRAYAISAAKPVSQLPPVSRPSSGMEPGSFIDASTGEKRSYGGSYDGRMVNDPVANAGPIARAQAPDVANVSTPSVEPVVSQRPSPVPAQYAVETAGGGSGGGGRSPQEEWSTRQRGGDIYKEVAARRQKREGPKRPGGGWRRNTAIGAAAGGGVALAGAGISNLINNERNEREERN